MNMALSSVMQMGVPSKLNNSCNTSPKVAGIFGMRMLRVSTTSTSTGRAVRCSSTSQLDGHVTERRSGNWTPSLWNVDYIQSLESHYKEEKHTIRANELIVQVKMVLEKETDPIRQLELIDDLQRLGLSDHFNNEFKQILNSVYHKYYKNNIGEMRDREERDLSATALAFRLLRQHGFQVSQDVFECYMSEEGEFKASLSDDTRGLLQLYEASFLLMEGENTLELAREFTRNLLQEKLINNDINDAEAEAEENLLLSSITYSLEIPIHWRIKRPNVSVWIDEYRRRRSVMNPLVLELAVLDSNIVQANFQDELKQDLRWWKHTCLVEKLPFARDRLVESYFWSVGFVEPRRHASARGDAAKVTALITVIDDVYDIYGTLEELEQFTEAIRRWDVSSIDQLPSFMQICFLALDNFINDIAFDILKDKGFNIIPYLRKSWRDLAEAYLIEARWYYSGHKPKLEEYLSNSWRSVGGAVILTHEFFRVTDSFTKETVDSLYGYHDLVRLSSLILRLADDLGTSVDEVSRGDVPKSIQCYMTDNNATEEEARRHVKWLIAETWKKLNEEMLKESPFRRDFIECAADLGRMAQFMYHYGDGHGMQHTKVHQRMTTCLFRPFASQITP